MSRGSKPKPANLRVLQGNPGKRPIPEGVPRPASKALEPPRRIKGAARREWRRLVKLFGPEGLGTLAESDEALIEAMVKDYALIVEAEERIEAQGPMLVGHTGNPYQSPWVGLRNRLVDRYYRFLTELGGSPSARMKVKADVPEPVDEFEAYLNKYKRGS